MPIHVKCHICERPLTRRPSHANRTHFCSRACQGKWRSQHTGENAAHWKGGMAIHRGGRVKVYRPDHPDANTRGYVWRHRIVAEEKIGRRLRPEEVVHHIDGDQTNDHPDNLEVYADQAEHARYHGKTKPRELIERMFTASPNYQKSRGVRHG